MYICLRHLGYHPFDPHCVMAFLLECNGSITNTRSKWHVPIKEKRKLATSKTLIYLNNQWIPPKTKDPSRKTCYTTRKEEKEKTFEDWNRCSNSQTFYNFNPFKWSSTSANKLFSKQSVHCFFSSIALD